MDCRDAENIPYLTPSRPGLVLAPMEGVMDAPMRAFLTSGGAFLFCVSEFIRVSSEVTPIKVFHRDVPEICGNAATPAGTPVQVQILGGHPGRMAESALNAIAAGAKGVDINFGCPAKTVNRHDGGASLLRSPCRILEIVSTVRQAVPKKYPVSVKVRLGWESTTDIFQTAEMVAKAGASWLTIHGRTRLQGYAPPVYWEPIGEVRKLLDMPVVANGDIWTLDDFKRCREVTGCDHFMLGRSVVANPSLSVQIAKELGMTVVTPDGFPLANAPTDWEPAIQSLVGFYQGTSRSDDFLLRRVKQWIRMASAKGEVDWFDHIKRSESLSQLMSRLRVPVESL